MQVKEISIQNMIKNKFIADFKYALHSLKINKNINSITFLCVGTDKIIGDSFGPFVGSKLEELFKGHNYYNINVCGTLSNNINHENIERIIDKIEQNTGIIIIDAALSEKENVGNIYVSNTKTTLGKGLAKNSLKIGDISIKTAVAKDYKIPYINLKSLQNASVCKIMELSDIVSSGIFEVINKFY